MQLHHYTPNMVCLSQFFANDTVVPFSVTSDVQHSRFELRSHRPDIVYATLQQPWRFVYSYTLGTDTVEKFIRGQRWMDRTKYHTHNTCVILTRTTEYATSLLAEDGTFPSDSRAIVCWMSLQEKLQLFIHLINTPKPKLQPQGHISKQLLPLLFELKSCDWITETDIPNETVLREKAKRSTLIHWLSYAHDTTLTLPHDTNPVDLTPHQLMLYTGYAAKVMAEKDPVAHFTVHAAMNWIKECMATYREGHWPLLQHVDEVFDRQKYDKWKRPERQLLFRELKKVVKDVLFALVLGNSDKEMKESSQGHVYRSNPKPISDRYQWLHRLPPSSDGKPSLHPAINPVEWVSYHSIETQCVLHCDFTTLDTLENLYEQKWVFMVMYDASALQVMRVLTHYAALLKPLHEQEPVVMDVHYQGRPVAVLSWHPSALHQLQCLAALNAASIDTTEGVVYHTALPLGKLLSWKVDAQSCRYQHLLNQYIRGIYILLGAFTSPNSPQNLLQVYARGNDIPYTELHTDCLNSMYVQLIAYLFDEARLVHRNKVPYQYLVTHIPAQDVRLVVLSLFTPHCYHAIHRDHVELMLNSYPPVYTIINKVINLAGPPVAVTLPWNQARNVKVRSNTPGVLCHDQLRLNDAKWYVVPPTKYVVLLEEMLKENVSADALWCFIHHTQSILPCSTTHLERVFVNTPYASDWGTLTGFIPHNAQPHTAKPSTGVLQDDEVLRTVKLLFVTMHMLLVGFTDMEKLLPVESADVAFLKEDVGVYLNMHDALFNDATTPIVVRDSNNRCIATLLDSFLLSDVFLPSNGSPVPSWYESLVAAGPSADPQYLQRVQQKHPHAVNKVTINVNDTTPVNNHTRKRIRDKLPSTNASPSHRVLNLHLEPFVDVTKQTPPYSPGLRRPLYDPTEPSVDALNNLPSTRRKQAIQSPRHAFLGATK